MSRLVPQSYFPSRDKFFFPFEEIINKVYDEILSDKNLGSVVKSKASYPKMDVYTKDGKFIIETVCPGVSEEDISVEVIPEDSGRNFVKISGKYSEEKKNTDANYFIKELTKGSFERLVSLPDYIKSDPEASLVDGVLYLTWFYEDVRKQKKFIPISTKVDGSK